MCLGIPGRIVAVDGLVATVDFFGVTRQVNLHIVDEPVGPGDYVLNHVGYAIRKIPEEDIAQTLAMYQELLAAAETDLMRQEVRAEIAAASGPKRDEP
jgi:hydrogenase expression/formation protein HypC